MSEETRLDKPERWEDLIGRNTRSGIWYRLRHTLWAGLIAFTFFAVSFFNPVDQLVWALQSRMGSAEPSGEFVYVSVDRDLSDPESPGRREDLARVLAKLEADRVEKVVIDFVFDQPTTARADTALSRAISGFDGEIALVPSVVQRLNGSDKVRHTLPVIRGDADELMNPDLRGILNYSWWMPRTITVDGEHFETLGNSLAGSSEASTGPLMIDYSIRVERIAQIEFEALSSADEGADLSQMLAGKTVIIGPSREANDTTVAIPGARNVPRGFVAIYAAESYLAGRQTYIGELPIMLTALFILCLISCLLSKFARRVAYTTLALSLPGIFLLSFVTGIRTELANTALFLALYAGMRLWFLWQRRAAMRDEKTGLGTLRALEERLTGNAAGGFVVVAKIHGYERVLKLLPVGLHPTYVRKIAERIKATEPDLEVFAGAHYFAWISTDPATTSLEDHLNGLRALFGAPLDIGGTPIDVGITFGVARIGGTSERALPAAMDAVEETSEAHEPVRFAVERSQDDSLWDISLRSRIDAAMNNGEVYCLYQPKYSLGTGTVAGVEALVRWDDHERGPIPPLVFVQESEKAGRIEQLTRYVLQSACTAGRLLHSRGHRITVSVNVSAIQCSDMSIVSTVEETLNASGFPASYLVLEVTETARIRDFASAARVLNRLKQLGVKLSMDDFGVGMANYETFYELPFDELKIDRLFIKNIQKDDKARAIASSLVQMGMEARITVTAEGVEDPEDLNILEEIGCTQVQGYAISRPITLPNLLDFLEKREKNMV